MKAAVIEGPGRLVVKDIPRPVCEDDTIIVKTHRAALCNATDVEIAEGSFPHKLHPPYPHVLGHESSGEIAEVGKNIRGWTVGDRIGFWCKMQGAFGEYNQLKVADLAITKLDDRVSFDEGAVLELVGGTMRLMYDAGIRPADTVAVLGQGPAGLILVQEAKIFGAVRTIGVDLIEQRRAMARRLGADMTLDPAVPDTSLFGKVDVVIDAVGNAKGINLGLDLLRPGGRYVIFGHATEDQKISMRDICLKDIRVCGFSCTMEKTQELLDFGQRLVAEARIQLKPLITHHVKLENLAEGLRLCKTAPASTLKVIADIVP
jgi:2-desacetyl-2-hydroxyethyl bacteriochlorophyllide A dehydrogenase